jgi:hypothetical protein
MMKIKPTKITAKQIETEKKAVTKKEIMRILKTNEYDYNNTLFETGLLWLEKNYSNTPVLIESYKKSQTFWKWYTTQYNIIDESFLEKVNSESLYQRRLNSLSKIYYKLQIEMNYFPSRVAQKLIHDEFEKEDASLLIIKAQKATIDKLNERIKWYKNLLNE